MPVYHYVWTDENTDHIRQHGISEAEFEHAVDRAPKKAEVTQPNGRIRIEGRTVDGRRVRCIFERIDELWVYPITAHEVEE